MALIGHDGPYGPIHLLTIPSACAVTVVVDMQQ